MQRLIEALKDELAICEAVFERRIRSYVLFLAALIAPIVVMLAATRMINSFSLPGLAQGLTPLLPLFSLLVMLKLLILSIRTYLRDRTALLRF